MERIDFQGWMPDAFDGKPFGPGDLVALEEEAGVGRCVVMPGAEDRPDNDGLAARIAGRPRMVGCAAVNPRLGEEAVEELERAVRDLGFRGLRLFPAVEAKGPEWDVAVTGVSCRQQVEHGTGRRARHVVEYLRDALA